MNEFLEKFRAQYPQYKDMSDGDLARALHTKFYSDLSFDDFAARIGLSTAQAPAIPIVPAPFRVPDVPDAVGRGVAATAVAQAVRGAVPNLLQLLKQYPGTGRLSSRVGSPLRQAVVSRSPSLASRLGGIAARGGSSSALRRLLPWGAAGGLGLYEAIRMAKAFNEALNR